MKRITLTAVLVLLPLLAACNTVEGFGQDVQKGGKSLERTADENK